MTSIGFAYHLVLIARFMSYENWAGWEKSNHLRPIYLKPCALGEGDLLFAV